MTGSMRRMDKRIKILRQDLGGKRERRTGYTMSRIHWVTPDTCILRRHWVKQSEKTDDQGLRGEMGQIKRRNAGTEKRDWEMGEKNQAAHRRKGNQSLLTSDSQERKERRHHQKRQHHMQQPLMDVKFH